MRRRSLILFVLLAALAAISAYAAETIIHPQGTATSVPWTGVTGTPTTLSGYGITDGVGTVADNSVGPLKLQYTGSPPSGTLAYFGDGTWQTPSASLQAQIDLKQNYDADLAVLSFPGNWKVFVSSGSHAITEIALGEDNTWFGSNGASALPSFKSFSATSVAWGSITSKPTTISGYGITDNILMQNGSAAGLTNFPTLNQSTSGNAATATALAANGANCSAGQAPLGVDASGAVEGCWTPTANLNNTTMDNTIITRGTIDNTVIGGTTPVAGTFTDGSFTSLTRGGVTDSHFSFLEGVASSIQGQLNLKRALDNVIFTAGNATFDNEVTALQFNSTGADNTHFINVANTGAPSGPVLGDCYYDNTALQWLCWSGSAWAGAAGDVTASSTNTFTNKTLDVSATSNVFKQYQYLRFDHPTSGVGWISFNDNGSSASGQATFSNSVDQATNCSYYYSVVPIDLDNSVDMSVLLKFSLQDADTGSHTYVVSMSNIADSTARGSGGVEPSNPITLAFSGDAQGAMYDSETIPWTTLTGWKTALTANNRFGIRVCRDGDAAGDSSTVDSTTIHLTIRYGSIQ